MPIVLSIIGILAFSVLLGALFDFSFLFLAIPLILIYLGGLLGNESMARQKRIMQLKRFRREARGKKVEFDEDDKKTIAI